MGGWLDWLVDGSVGGGWSDTDLITISIPILIDMLFMNKNRYQFIPDVPDVSRDKRGDIHHPVTIATDS